MEQRVAIVTGGLRGLGRAMAFRSRPRKSQCCRCRHIDADVAEVEEATAGGNLPGQILPLVADLRQPADCDGVVAMAQERFGGLHILVNNAGLTFTTIDPRASAGESAEILAAAGRRRPCRDRDQLHRRGSDGPPRRGAMVEQRWPYRQCDTKLDTMNRAHTSPYGASKAALEMATEVWPRRSREPA